MAEQEGAGQGGAAPPDGESGGTQGAELLGQQQPSGPPVPVREPRPREPGSRRWGIEKAEELEQRLARQDEELSRWRQQAAERESKMEGMLQALLAQRQEPARSAPPPPQQQEEDPDQIIKQAVKKLDNEKDFNGFIEDYGRAISLKTERKLRKEWEEKYGRQQQGPAMDPGLMVMAAQFPNVAFAGQAGFARVAHIDRGLELDGMPPGPQRLRKAFEMANEALGQQGTTPVSRAPATQQFSRSTAPMLSGVPSTRSGGGTDQGGPRVRLRPDEEAIAKRFGMTTEEYAYHLAQTHPERVER